MAPFEKDLVVSNIVIVHAKHKSMFTVGCKDQNSLSLVKVKKKKSKKTAKLCSLCHELAFPNVRHCKSYGECHVSVVRRIDIHDS